MKLFVDITELVLPTVPSTSAATQENAKASAPVQNVSCVDVIKDAVIAITDDTDPQGGGRIAFAGRRADLLEDVQAENRISLGGRAVVPGLIDAHTHIVFAQDRVQEFAMRTQGATYEDIAAAGGGILNSVAHLEKASTQALVTGAQRRLQQMRRKGTTTCEIKTGYGLHVPLELRQMEVIAELAATEPTRIVGTLLAHVIPQEFRENPNSRRAYIDSWLAALLPAAQAKPDIFRYCDVFVEEGAFTHHDAQYIAAAAIAAGLQLKLHVDQLRPGKGAQLAAQSGALSADHLEYTDADGARALAAAGSIATILPGCTLFLGKGPWADGRLLKDSGCHVAIASDCNPGSSTTRDLCLCATLACTQCGLNIEEALWGITQGGAMALGLADRGALVRGQWADFVVVDDTDWRSLLYIPGDPPIYNVYIGGIPQL